MKRFAISALALGMLASGAAPSFAGQYYGPAPVQQVQYDGSKRVIIQKKVVRKPIVRKPIDRVERRHFERKRWHTGQRYSGWQRANRVDYKRYHLRRPGHGQQWVRVDNDYLLVAIGTGLIISAIAAR